MEKEDTATTLTRTDVRVHMRHVSGLEQDALALLIYRRDGVQVIPLAEGRSLTLGRQSPSDVVILDEAQQIGAILIAAVTLGEGAQLGLADISTAIGDFLGTRDHQPLPLFHRLDEVSRLD